MPRGCSLGGGGGVGGGVGSRPDRGGEGSGGRGVNRYQEGLRLTPQEGDTMKDGPLKDFRTRFPEPPTEDRFQEKHPLPVES